LVSKNKALDFSASTTPAKVLALLLSGTFDSIVAKIDE